MEGKGPGEDRDSKILYSTGIKPSRSPFLIASFIAIAKKMHISCRKNIYKNKQNQQQNKFVTIPNRINIKNHCFIWVDFLPIFLLRVFLHTDL